MQPRYRFRLYLLTALVLVGFGALLSRLHDFQINRRDEFQRQVPGERIVQVREPGIRGEITDRNGIALARNVRSYEVSFNLDEIYRAYRRQHPDMQLVRIVERRGMNREQKEKDIVGVVNETVIPVLKRLNLAKNYRDNDLRIHYITHSGLVPFSYRTDLTYEEFARFAEHSLELPGVYLSSRSDRQYPYGTLASHVLGYLRQWDKDIPTGAARKFDHYIGEDKGVEGIESTMDDKLRGPEGVKEMLRDEKGAIRGMFNYTQPGVGARVELTLDARVQYLTENALRHAGRAAAVVMDVETGEILAMASVPDYNPNLFIPKISSKQWVAYKSNKSTPFTNRAISAFTPGSTFKIVTALSAALYGKGMIDRAFSCDGYIQYGTNRVGCWIWNQHKGSHGLETLTTAIKQSCNPFFNKMANAIGWKAMVDGFTMLGFGRPTGIPLHNESSGVIPGTRAWRGNDPNRQMAPVITAWLSIGQGATATPLQLCTMLCSVANGGKYYKPRIVKKIVASDGQVLVEDKPDLSVDLLKEGVKPADLALIRKGMWMAVNEPGGTAGRAKIPGIEVAAKTGTAQVDVRLKTHNSWMMAFAPYDKPKYAVCVLVEEGKSGGKVCGPLVQMIIRGLIARDGGAKLPLQPQTEYGGHRNPIEEIVIPEDPLANLEMEDPGENAEDTDDSGAPVVQPAVPEAMPAIPTIEPETDDQGVEIPRAVPVRQQ